MIATYKFNLDNVAPAVFKGMRPDVRTTTNPSAPFKKNPGDELIPNE